MITTYDNVKLKPTKKVLNQMLKDYLENISSSSGILKSLATYWDVSKMTQRERDIIVVHILDFFMEVTRRESNKND